ncbi:MAG: hypothetical protein L0H63_08595 [Nitrococcus sp.]|nr:hypothetical protein [Nitrococcus sp.]
MSRQPELLTTNQKALTINLDQGKYGTFAEIGAGQEVAHNFFQAGAASGTIAKTMSAYDMTVSDDIYGKAPRYVSQQRLLHMLSFEYNLLIERLDAQRGNRSCFFVFADTVATRNHSGTNEAHGWMGIRIQSAPASQPCDIIMHVRMWDRDAVLQQEALGIVGTNLVYGAFYLRDDPKQFIQSLLDNLGADRIEVDMLEMHGHCFAGVDNRLLSLHLVELGLTNAVMFGPKRVVLQPSEVLYKKPVLVERGSFRPVTHVNVDMLKCATAQFKRELLVKDKDFVVLMEITMSNLLASGSLNADDFLSRVDLLADLGFTVLISNYLEFYRLTSYFRRYTKEMIGVALGISSLIEIFNEKFYENLEGGILEAFGRLFRHCVKLYVYPMRQCAYQHYLATGKTNALHPLGAAPSSCAADDKLITAETIEIPVTLSHLYQHLLGNCYIECITGFNADIMHIFSSDVLARIQRRDSTWEQMVPAGVAAAIKQKRLFGCTEIPPCAP